MLNTITTIAAVLVLLIFGEVHAASPGGCLQDQLNGIQGCHLYTNGEANYLDCLAKVKGDHKTCLLSVPL